MQRDIDRIADRLKAETAGFQIVQLQVAHPGDDDGLWFISVPNHPGIVQLESWNGMCPFLIESDFNDERFHANTMEAAISRVKQLYSI